LNSHTNGSTELYNRFLKIKENEDIHNPAIDNHTVCVYGWFIDDVCVYVGQTMNLLYRMCDHLYYAMHPQENESNRTLYNILNYALFKCDSKVTIVSLVTIEEGRNYGYQQCKHWLDAYESQIISTRLPILNKIIPWINGLEDRRQIFEIKKGQIHTLFTPKFEEHRELLNYDYRKFYGYIYNEHYDDIIKNKKYDFGYNIKTNKYIQQVLTSQNDYKE
jgi:hypothetical protein